MTLIATLTTQAATSYGFSVGGVEVTSDNCQNITGPNITTGTAVYNPSTKQLTLTNVNISCSGSKKYCIRNTDCNSLNIVFKGSNTLSATGGAPVFLQQDTYIRGYDANSHLFISGSNNQDALCPIRSGSGVVTLSIVDANMTILSTDCEAIDGEGKGTVNFVRSNVVIDAGSYGINRLAVLSIEDSYISITSSNYITNGISRMSTFGGINVTSPEGGYFNTNNGYIFDSNGTRLQNTTAWLTPLTDVAVNQTNFPDEFFRHFVTNKFGTTLKAIDRLNTDELNLETYSHIADLTGIKYFDRLQVLRVPGNNLTTLDMSDNKLLRYLEVQNNKLTLLDLRSNPKLTFLNCRDNQIRDLRVNNLDRLSDLNCRNNKIQNLDVSTCPDLTNLDCDYNQLSRLNLTQNKYLKTLYCNNNNISSLDLNYCTRLTKAWFHNNKLTGTFSLGNNTKLTDVNCNSNDISTLLLPNNPTSLEILDCSSNRLSTFDLSAATGLKKINVQYNQLTSMKLPSAPLTEVSLYGNKLNKLAVDTLLTTWPDYDSSSFGGFADVYSEKKDDQGNRIDYNVFTPEHVATLKQKGWKVIYIYYSSTSVFTQSYDGMEGIEIAYPTFIDGMFRYCLKQIPQGLDTYLTYYEIPEITSLDVRGKEIESLGGIQNLTALEKLLADNNKLVSITYTRQLPALKHLSLANNQVTALQLGSNPELTFLDCMNNKIVSLDLTSNTKLAELNCAWNGIKSLTVSSEAPLYTEEVAVYCNQLSTAARVNNFITQLKAAPSSKPGVLLFDYNSDKEANVITEAQIEALAAKNWQIKRRNADTGAWEIVAPPATPGDIDGNGSVDVADLNMLINFLLGTETPTAAQFAAANIDNTNNSIDVGDLNAIIGLLISQ